jgi:hypothetical protein
MSNRLSLALSLTLSLTSVIFGGAPLQAATPQAAKKKVNGATAKKPHIANGKETLKYAEQFAAELLKAKAAQVAAYGECYKNGDPDGWVTRAKQEQASLERSLKSFKKKYEELAARGSNDKGPDAVDWFTTDLNALIQANRTVAEHSAWALDELPKDDPDRPRYAADLAYSQAVIKLADTYREKASPLAAAIAAIHRYRL